MSPRSEKLTFQNAQGHELAGRLELPDSTPLAYALFAHCFTCSKDVAAASRISRALRKEGFAVLRFDFTGLGNSDGDFANTNFSSNVEDLVAAAKHLEREHKAPQLLIGHSLGGAAVLRAAPQLESVRAVATIGAPGEPVHVQHLFAEHLQSIEDSGSAQVEIGGRSFKIKKHFIEDLERHKLKDSIQDLRKALLILHSPQDNIVGIDNAREIFQAARHPKSFVSLDGADHLLSDKRDSEYVGMVLAAWARRYLQLAEDETGKAPEEIAGEPGLVIVETADGKFTQTVTTATHSFLADEPAKLGGDDRGPNPYELLLASLGACTAMTIQMYVGRKGWPLEKVRVELRHDRVHAEDCQDCDAEPGTQVERLERVLHITGDLTEEQREKILGIANKCPVHKTLLGNIKIPTRLA